MSENRLFLSGKKMKNRNPRADPYHYQKSTTSRGSSLVRACQVWSTSVSAFVSYPAINGQPQFRKHCTHITHYDDCSSILTPGLATKSLFRHDSSVMAQFSLDLRELEAVNALSTLNGVSETQMLDTQHQRRCVMRTHRVGHGLGPSMGWVGLGWVRVFLIFGGLGWVGWRLDCVIFLTS